MVGWRSWVVVQHQRQLRLRSVVFDTIWPAQEELLAACNRRWARIRLPFLRRRGTTHGVPSAQCSCGIHASRRLEKAADYLYLYRDLPQPHLRYRAIGRVSLWGSVVEGEDGWRASCAYPERIFLPGTDNPRRRTDVEAIREGLADYGVPIEVLDDDDNEAALVRAVRRVQPERRQRRTKTSS